MPTQTLTPPRLLPLLAGWLVANLVGGALGGLLEARLQFLGTLVLVGSTVGLLQWCLLRRDLAHPVGWAWAMVLGWPLGSLLRVAMGDFFTPLITTLTLKGWLWEVFWLNLLEMPVTLAVVGLLQALWLPPRRQTVPSWLLANVVGGAVLGGVGATVCFYACDAITAVAGTTATGLVLGALSWAGYALVTGPVLAALLRHR